MKAIQKLKNGIKAEGISIRYSNAMTLWESKKIQSDWRNLIIIPLPKKGDLIVCNRPRAGVLHCCQYQAKIFSSILLERLQDAADSQVQ